MELTANYAIYACYNLILEKEGLGVGGGEAIRMVSGNILALILFPSKL